MKIARGINLYSLNTDFSFTIINQRIQQLFFAGEEFLFCLPPGLTFCIQCVVIGLILMKLSAFK